MSYLYEANIYILPFIILSMITGCYLGLQTINIPKILASSSIYHVSFFLLIIFNNWLIKDSLDPFNQFHFLIFYIINLINLIGLLIKSNNIQSLKYLNISNP